MLTKLAMMVSTATFSLFTPPKLLSEPVDGRCVRYEPMLEQIQPDTGWDVEKMSRIMWRESRCTTNIRSTTSDTGLLQINDVNHPWLSERWNTTVGWGLLTIPQLNVLAAAALCDYWKEATGDCYQPWQTTR